MSSGLAMPKLELVLNRPVPFEVAIDSELLDVTKQKLALARYPEEQEDFGEDDWSQGAKVKRVKELAEYWQTHYEWEKHQVRYYRIAPSLRASMAYILTIRSNGSTTLFNIIL